MGEYVPALVPGQELRDDLKPLEILQPEGVSFTLDGNVLRWQRWSMRLGFNPREGSSIHTLGYKDGERRASVAHRMSFAEMVVPYRDPDGRPQGAHGVRHRRVGPRLHDHLAGAGLRLPGRDQPTSTPSFTTPRGEPRTIKNAICIHEEDDAVLWKHVDPQAGAEVRRSRRLVVSFHATVANYEYLVYWRFYQDGNIECEVRATGIMVTTHFPEGEQPPYGTLVDERTYAPFHQHFIVARLDLDVDGEENTVHMTESEALPIGAGQPRWPGARPAQHAAAHRGGGQAGLRLADPARLEGGERELANGLGTPVGYKLVPAALPGDDGPASPVFRRAQVIGHNLWVTPYEPDERWPCGEFPVQARRTPACPPGPRPTARSRTPTWCSGTCSAPPRTRPEEWPVMPVDTVSFWLKPVGFFDRNPALDVLRA